MEAEHRGVAERGRAHSVALHAEGMCGVIDHLEAVLLCDVPDGIGVAEVTVDVDGHDRAGVLIDEVLYLRRIERVVIFLDIGKDRLKALSHDRVRGGGEGEGRRDDLAGKPHRLKHALERVVPVRE